MNTEKAIDLLDNLIGMIEDNQDNDYDTAFHMAIEALKKLPSACKYRRTYHEVEGYFKKREVCYNKKNAAECNGDCPLLTPYKGAEHELS